MKGLQHGFVAGLRFAGMPQFCTASGEYKDLPPDPWATVAPADALCIAQCFALAGYDAEAGLAVPPVALTSAQALQPWLASQLRRHDVQVGEASGSGCPAAVGSMVKRALWAQGLALLQLQPARDGSTRRWVLITGVEWREYGQGNETTKSKPCFYWIRQSRGSGPAVTTRACRWPGKAGDLN